MTFVVGAPRSGTTLIQKVIESHSRYFAHDDETAMFTLQNIFRLNRKHFGLEDKKLIEALNNSNDVVDFFEKQVNRLQDDRGGDFFVEKTPQHIRHLPFILKKFPNCRIVHVVRDGRDNYCSARDHSGVPQGTSVQKFAPYWSKLVELGLAVDEDQRLIQVHYERFTENQVTEATRLMEHLKCDFEPSQLDSSARSQDHRADKAEFQRLKEKISNKSVGRWKNEMSSKEAATFKQLAGRTLQRLGYSLD